MTAAAATAHQVRGNALRTISPQRATSSLNHMWSTNVQKYALTFQSTCPPPGVQGLFLETHRPSLLNSGLCPKHVAFIPGAQPFYKLRPEVESLKRSADVTTCCGTRSVHPPQYASQLAPKTHPKVHGLCLKYVDVAQSAQSLADCETWST